MWLSLCALNQQPVNAAVAAGRLFRTKQLGLHNSAQLVAGLPSHLASGCLIVVRQHFCHLEPPLPLRLSSLLEHRGLVVSSTFPAHSSTTVINTSTDPVLRINNNIPVWLAGMLRRVAGSAMTRWHCCQLLLLFGCLSHILKIGQI